MKHTITMKKIYNSNLLWLILSFIAAVALWSYITSLETDVYTRTFRGVQVELSGEETLKNARNMVITDLDFNTVTLEVTGPRRTVASLDASDIKAVVDVSKLTIAAYMSQTYRIVFPDKIDTSDLSVTRKTPETINFMASAITSKTIQVRGSFDGSVAENRTAEMPQFEPSTITVTGPESYVRNISYAWVTFGAENIDKTYITDADFVLMTEDGTECSMAGLTVSDESVLATLTLLEVKEVPLAVNLSYGAGSNENNTEINIEPSSVSLAGDSAVLSGMNRIVLAEIDTTAFDASYTDMYAIMLPDGVRNLSGTDAAKVTVTLSDLTTASFKIANFSCINTTEGYEAEIVTTSLDAVLRGTKEELEAISSANLRAVADLLDYNESVGTFMPLVKIYVDGFPNVGTIGTYTITVDIVRREE